MAWLTGWNYRKSHVISEETGAGTDYLVLIKVYKDTGTDGTEEIFGGLTGGKVYCGTNVEDDFGDVRFTTSDETTEEEYMLEYYSSGAYAYFWVKISGDVGAGDVTIYIYYGKSGQATSSTDLMEDFTGYIKNNGDVNVVDSHQIIHTVHENDDEWAYIDKTSIDAYWVQGKVKWTHVDATGCYAISCAVADDIDERKGWIDDSDDYVAILQLETDDVYIERGNSGVSNTKVGDLTESTYYWYVLKRSVDTNTLYIYSDEAKTTLVGSQSQTLGTTFRYLFAANLRNRNNSESMLQYSEDMFFRFTIDTEPSHGAWGSEETLVAGVSGSIVQILQGIGII